jgi:hypothetical protein
MKKSAHYIAIVLTVFLFSSGWLNPASAVPGSVKFSVSHGFYYTPFSVVLSCEGSVSGIWYTTDGSAPSTQNGKKYSTPLEIKSTTVLRGVAYENNSKGKVTTCSYLFPEDIIRQSNTPPGYPASWGNYTDISGVAIADYEMDPDIVNHPAYKNLMIPALLSVPSVSLVTEKGNLFSKVANPDTGGIYIYTGANGKTGDNWERPVSAEYIIPGSKDGFQVNCGLQIQGGASRLAEKNPKHSFRLAFRDSLGVAKLRYPLFEEGATDIFNGIVLRASFGNTWRHWESAQRTRATHVQDLWAKDTQLEMGHISAHSRYVHLYLNGIYWGLYNISERIDDDFLESYIGGDKSEYDIVKDYEELMCGTKDAWNYLWTTVNGQITNTAVYEKLIGNNPDGTRNPSFPAYIDPVSLCDYMLINFYGGNNDWDHHNWSAGRNRVNPQSGFTFFCWDSEKILENVNENYVSENNERRPSGIFSRLMANAEFRMLFADRVNLHMANNGLLTPEKVIARWLKRADQIDTALVAESARWSDYRRDVHPWSSAPYTLYTVNDHWMVEKKRLIDSYFPARTRIVLDQLTLAGKIPAVPAPFFSQSGGKVTNDFRLVITSSSGFVYYTLDGSDPRLTGGKINPSASPYINPVKTGAITEIKARTRLGETWSALTAATFYNENYNPGSDEEVKGKETLTIFPNPVKEYTYIRYSLPRQGDVVITVFHTDGRAVSTIQKGFQEAGEHILCWGPQGFIPGLYILQLATDNFRLEQKIIILR